MTDTAATSAPAGERQVEPGVGTSARERGRALLRSPDARSLMVVLAIAAAWRVLLLQVWSAPIFFHDSATYLANALDVQLVWDRPPGTSLFYRVVLELWADPRAILVAQGVLGAAVAGLAYTAARLLDLPRWPAAAVAMLVTLAPSNLLFERMYMSEAASAFWTMTSITLLLLALRRPRWWAWLAVGVSLALGTVVRLQGTVVLLAVVFAVLLLWRSAALQRRFVAAVLVVAGAAPLLAGLAWANGRYVDVPGAGPALSYGGGFALFTKIARELDCADVEDESRLVRQVCAEPRSYRENPNGMAWGGPGPVTLLRDRLGPVRANEVLQQEALEAVQEDPAGYLRTVWLAVEDFWATEDLEPDAFTADPRPDVLDNRLLRELDYAFGIPVGEYPAPETDDGRTLYDAHVTWNGVRRVAWAGVLLAFVAALLPGTRGRPERDGTAVVAGVLGATLLGTVLSASVIVPRYWYPFEAPAWLLTAVVVAWMVRAVRARRSARLPQDAGAATAG